MEVAEKTQKYTPTKVMQKRKKSLFKNDPFRTFLLILPYGLVFSVFIALPVAVAIGLSFTYFDVINTPRPIGLLNYINLFTQDEVFMKNVLPNTFKYALIIGPGGYILQFLLAWMLTQIQKLPRTILSLILYMPSLASGVVIGVIFKVIFSGDKKGIINNLGISLGILDRPVNWLINTDYLMDIMIIVSLWSAMGIGFLAMISGILNIDEEQYEAAYVDGIKNRFQEIVYITIPNMKPQMLFGAVMAIVNAFNTGHIGVTLSGGNPTPGYAGQLIVNHLDDYGFARYEMGYAAAISVMLLLLVWVFSKVAHRLFGERD